MKSTVEMHEQELLLSEKEKINFYPELELDCEKPHLVKVKFQGIEVGRLIVSVKGLDWNPSGGFKLDLQVRNITPLK